MCSKLEGSVIFVTRLCGKCHSVTNIAVRMISRKEQPSFFVSPLPGVISHQKETNISIFNKYSSSYMKRVMDKMYTNNVKNKDMFLIIQLSSWLAQLADRKVSRAFASKVSHKAKCVSVTAVFTHLNETKIPN